MPEASKAQKATMDKLGIRHNKDTSMRDASMQITARAELLQSRLMQRDGSARIVAGLVASRYSEKPRCTDCDEPLTPTEKLSLMPDGTTGNTNPKRPLCNHCFHAEVE